MRPARCAGACASTPTLLLAPLLAPHLASFLDRYPELSLDLVARDQLGDLVAEGFDIAVRFGEPPSSSLVARKLHGHAHRHRRHARLPQRHGRPAKPADLVDHACLQVRNPVTGQPSHGNSSAAARSFKVPTTGRLLLTDAGTILATALAGVGVAQIKAVGIQRTLDSGEFVDLFPDWTGERFPLYALYPSRHLPAAKVRAFIDFVMEVLERPMARAAPASPTAPSPD